MKYTLPVAMMAICLFAGCSKLSKSTKGRSKGSMTAVINGDTLVHDDCQIATSSRGGLDIVGTNESNKDRHIELIILNYTAGATGTFSITPLANDTISAVLYSSYGGDMARSGTITIEKSSESSISGTFSFTCENGIVYNVTNGVFEAKK